MEAMFPAMPYIFQSGLNTSGEIESALYYFPFFVVAILGRSKVVGVCVFVFVFVVV